MTPALRHTLRRRLPGVWRAFAVGVVERLATRATYSADLARALRLAEPTVRRELRRLEAAGLVEHRPGHTRRRLTAEGRRLAEALGYPRPRPPATAERVREALAAGPAGSRTLAERLGLTPRRVRQVLAEMPDVVRVGEANETTYALREGT